MLGCLTFFPLAKVGIFAISGLQKPIFFGLKYAKTICFKAGFVKSAPFGIAFGLNL